MLIDWGIDNENLCHQSKHVSNNDGSYSGGIGSDKTS